MKKTLFLITFTTITLFGAAEEVSVVTQFEQAVKAFNFGKTQDENAVDRVFELGKGLTPRQRMLASDEPWMLQFIFTQHESGHINENHKDQYLDLIAARSPVWRAIISNNFTYIRLRLDEENKRIELEERFNHLITTYTTSSCDARTAMSAEILETAEAINSRNPETLKELTLKNPFANLISTLIDDNNIHALREIQNHVPGIAKSTADLIYQTIKEYEDSRVTPQPVPQAPINNNAEQEQLDRAIAQSLHESENPRQQNHEDSHVTPQLVPQAPSNNHAEQEQPNGAIAQSLQEPENPRQEVAQTNPQPIIQPSFFTPRRIWCTLGFLGIAAIGAYVFYAYKK